MKHKLWGSLTAVILLPVLSLTSSGHAESISAPKPNPELIQGKSLTGSEATDVIKVGEYQSQQANAALLPDSVAKIKAHELNQQQAATLYIRNIPVLTFIKNTNFDPKAITPPTLQRIKVGSYSDQAYLPNPTTPATQPTVATDPVSRATAVAAEINQLIRNNFDASTIQVRWDAQRQRYLIEAAGQELVSIDSQTILPDTTNDTATDALQATNRLRRQIGNAPPLNTIEGQPKLSIPDVATGFLFRRIEGWASWYGPGFDGNLTANGETFNQYDLTAAHPSLPFGTTVRVTNKDNGQSVVVRINDRGPYAGGRVLDLSKGAAQAIGMIGSGVAPVQIDVLTANQ
ncbi:septal ring lytic transglycosylase RlpA family protein [Planktothrix agardhii]|jgi:rare lipoprotein A|uniref:septal ring lytic transglycosylase RlpA family protein n=1 Tax=Planktothrix agardhii TaxID=1160 RepID=UPI0020A74C32|nr:septal ring lytic transglycosylase RlpA family protein [Planktothrix agardhii]CAD5971212.1 putative endolytic peptidoglycan transglycosylase RlpA [Planktothrix agardhii]